MIHGIGSKSKLHYIETVQHAGRKMDRNNINPLPDMPILGSSNSAASKKNDVNKMCL